MDPRPRHRRTIFQIACIIINLGPMPENVYRPALSSHKDCNKQLNHRISRKTPMPAPNGARSTWHVIPQSPLLCQ